MGSWNWLGKGDVLLSGDGASSSRSAPPDGITQISETVYSLSEPAGPPEIEIVFVHGLSLSDYKQAYWKTWTAGAKDKDGKEVIWPMSWLGKELPGARILSLSLHDFSLIHSASRMDFFSLGEALVQEMVDIAKVGQHKCPVVFVCHCVGGLVAKQIVVMAFEKFGKNPGHVNFLQNIRGFFFYATPHQGFRLTNYFWGFPYEVMGTMGTWNSIELGRLNGEFQRIERDHFANRWKFAVVAELNYTTFRFGFRAQVVEESSARHVYDNFLNVSGDHFDVCKPHDETSVRYQALLRFISLIPVRHSVSSSELCDDKEITIFRVGDFAQSTTMPFDMDLKERFVQTKKVILEILSRMEKLWTENKVIIWHKQCEHLLERYRGGVDMIVRALDALFAVEGGPMISLNPPLVKFICSTLLRSVLEGEASLIFCCKKQNYTNAAFALSSPRHPDVPTFSRFALVLRELDWTLDFMCCIEQQYVDGKSLSFDDWKWCEKRCRPVFVQGGCVMEEEILEADGRRQTQDRFALLTASSPLKPKSASLVDDKDNQDKLEAIWTERLTTTSLSSGSNPLPDCFWIDNPDSLERVGLLANGAFKAVEKMKWLGETVAVGVVTGFPKEQLTAEAGLLAIVQHPNVVELMHCAYHENDSRSFLATELMERDLDSLICRPFRSQIGCQATINGPPFALPVAVDIALQIVEAMVHVEQCGVIHRDLKPNNCLVSPKYRKDESLPGLRDVPMYYTVKLIDFGTSKSRGENSYFATEKRGTAYYMAPEVFQPSGKGYKISADVWSFGVTCYKIFTGKVPFETSVVTLKDIFALINEGWRPQFPDKFPERLKELIQDCLFENPKSRPTFKKIREDLWQCKLYYAWSSDETS